MNDHDLVITAFRTVLRKLNPAWELGMGLCHRSGKPGYTHIHGPSQPIRKKCFNLPFHVQCHNGAVCFRPEIEEPPFSALPGAVDVQDAPIQVNPHGKANQGIGVQSRVILPCDILQHWPTLEDFVQDAIQRCQKQGIW